MQSRCLLTGMLALCVGCAPGALNSSKKDEAKSSSGAASAGQSQSAKAEDQRIELLLVGKDEDGDKAIPVEEFFGKLGNGYMIWKGKAEWFKKLAEDVKAAGAPAMYALVGEALGSTQVCAQYVITMPAEPAARSKVIDAYNNFWRSGWEQLSDEERQEAEEDLPSELTKDVGQKYLLLSYDP